MEKIGVVGVDSGQLIICDPCYIDSQWGKEEYKDVRAVIDKKAHKIFNFGEDFKTYEDVLEPYGKKVNDLLKDGTLEDACIKKMPRKNFSYYACCAATDGEKQAGQLNYALGHPGVAVAFRSGLGDGTYDVMAEYEEVPGWGRRIVKIQINLVG